MLSVEVRINGTIIVCMSVHNARQEGDLCKYEYQNVSFPVDCKGPPTLKHGTVNHWRSEGAEVLVRKLFQALTEQHP